MAGRPGGRAARARLLAVPPIGAFLFARLVLYAAAVRAGSGHSYFRSDLWSRWDSAQYVSIARRGYFLRHCPHTGAFPAHSWCGNAAWLPLYPWMMSVPGHLGVSLPAAGVCLSVAATLGLLLLVWVMLEPAWSVSRVACLALAAVFPGQVYFHAVFPISLMALLSLGFVALLARDRYALAGLTGAASVLAYSTGFLLAPVAVVWTTVAGRGKSFGRWSRNVLCSAGPIVAAFCVLLVGFEAWVGRWNAFFLVQAKYTTGLHNPLATFAGSLRQTAGSHRLDGPNAAYGRFAPKAQTVLVAVLVVLGVGATVRAGRRTDRTDLAVAIYTVTVWLFALAVGRQLSRYRAEALLVPVVLLIRHLPTPLQIALLIAATWTAVAMGALFFQSVLI